MHRWNYTDASKTFDYTINVIAKLKYISVYLPMINRLNTGMSMLGCIFYHIQTTTNWFIGGFTSRSTVFQLYLWRHIDVQAAWRSWTYSRAHNAMHRHFLGLFKVPNTDTGPFCQSSNNWTSLWHNMIRTHNLRIIRHFVKIKQPFHFCTFWSFTFITFVSKWISTWLHYKQDVHVKTNAPGSNELQNGYF